ncbi:hypothetical protein BDZ89DRAFT_1005758 [Hymenopellis radicata]|nr:hypothetical protein BDZ89DRAFT_1005758 [Hymenopellis radicata]
MIILDQANQQAKLDVAGPTLRFPEIAVGRSSSPLPDYETSQAQHGITTAKSLHDRADRRFWRATLYALCIYILLSAAIGVPLLVTRLSKQHHGHPPWPPGGDDSSGTLNTKNLANNGVFMMEDGACNSWDDTDDITSQSLYIARTSHTFSPQDSISIRSNVSHEADDAVGISGNITVNSNPDPSISSVAIHVSLSTSTLNLRHRTFLCFVDKGDDRGLSIYVPKDMEQESLTVDIIVLLPQPQATSMLSFDTLTTYLPMFPQIFGDLGRSIAFKKVHIEGAAMDISCDFLQAPKISVKNALAGISGTFNASEKLVLDNIGGPISANITLVQGDDRTAPTFFSLDTGNSEIDANVTMLVTSRFSDPINFIGTVKNFNGPLTLDIAHDADTPPIPLDLHVQNTQAASNVTLDSKYVGTFDVQTKLATVSVKETKEDPLSDPFGEDQYRSYIYDSTSSNRIRGWVGWGKRQPGWHPKAGHVEIVSSLSPILLQLGPGT